MIYQRVTQKINRTLFELICGILFYGFAAGIIEIIVVQIVKSRGADASALWNLKYVLAGHVIGIVIAVAYSVHMWWSIDRALDFDEDTAVKKQTINYVIRYVVLIIALSLVCMTQAVSPISAFIGIMGIKIGAYLNKPMKLISNIFYGIEPRTEETI